MQPGKFTNTHRCAFFLLLVPIVLMINSPGLAQIYSLNSDLPSVTQTPGSLNFLKPLNSMGRFFAEVSGNEDEDDPLSDFLTYINDPVNWDPTTFIDRRFVYKGNFGFQQTGKRFDIPGIISLGVQTRVEQALVSYHPPSSGEEISSSIPLNLLDGIYSPYLTLQAHPLPWLRVLGDARLDVVSFDVQGVCRTTCSKEPNGKNNEVIPSLKGNVILGPWLGTELFLNLGTGFYNPEDREPEGSTIEEKVNRTIVYEGGIRTQPWNEFELTVSLWSAELQSDLFFLEDGETIVNGGPSKRVGTNLGVQVDLSEGCTLAGNLSVSQAEFRQTGQRVPLAPELTSQISLTSEWNNGWHTTFQMNYIGQRPDEENATMLSSLTSFNLIGRFKPSNMDTLETLEMSLSILNLTNTTGPSSQFFFDSSLEGNQPSVATMNYFPGQPRMFVGGLTWNF